MIIISDMPAYIIGYDVYAGGTGNVLISFARLYTRASLQVVRCDDQQDSDHHFHLGCPRHKML